MESPLPCQHELININPLLININHGLILWADSINNESVKNDAMIKAGSVYLRRDYSNANQWLESSGLPDAIKAKINSPSKK